MAPKFGAGAPVGDSPGERIMTVYGECQTAKSSVQVSISGLRRDGCELTFAAHEVPEDGALTIWIGAVGPIRGRAGSRQGSMVALEFEEVLDERVMLHFAAA